MMGVSDAGFSPEGSFQAGVSQSFPAPTLRFLLQFDRASRIYEPLESITVRYEVAGAGAASMRAMERSILWYTEGKGEEDIGVHFFERITNAPDLPEVLPQGFFSNRLPASPLSYEGVIVKVRWCVRLRVFFEAGRDFVSEHVFSLGRIPPIRQATGGGRL